MRRVEKSTEGGVSVNSSEIMFRGRQVVATQSLSPVRGEQLRDV